VDTLGDPCHWGTAWTGLKKTSISYSATHLLPVLDFYFLSEYLQAKESNITSTSHFYYLDRKNAALLESGRSPSTFAEEAQKIAYPPLTFLIVEHPRIYETPFFMMFNIARHEALLITVGGNQEQQVVEQLWFQKLWRSVTDLFKWPHRSSHPNILYGNWIAVCPTFLDQSR